MLQSLRGRFAFSESAASCKVSDSTGGASPTIQPAAATFGPPGVVLLEQCDYAVFVQGFSCLSVLRLQKNWRRHLATFAWRSCDTDWELVAAPPILSTALRVDFEGHLRKSFPIRHLFVVGARQTVDHELSGTC